MTLTSPAAVAARSAITDADEILTREALALVAELERRFGPTRRHLLDARARRAAELAGGAELGLLPATAEIRDSDWAVAPVPAALLDRRVEITGPVDRRMMLHALNSGSRGFMADFEDALTPTWDNIVAGQLNLRDAVNGTLADGELSLARETAVLHVRPRGWHLDERHVEVDGAPVTAALFDVGVYAWHNAEALVAGSRGPYLYLPKLESHLEARLWREVLVFLEDHLELPRSSFRVTVLIETVPAAFEMEEILFELREHIVALNAGRWDYIFSMIKCHASRPEFLLPDRSEVKMTVPFMRAYTERLVKTCHRRGAMAIGGMAALIPNRRDAEASQRALAAVASDKRREAGDGFDGTWVAHPDVVATAAAEFDAVLGTAPNQLSARAAEPLGDAGVLLAVQGTPGQRTAAGLQEAIEVSLLYLTSWFDGRGAAAIRGLMEDAATAEIARSLVWHWAHLGAALDDGSTVDRARLLATVDAFAAQQPISDSGLKAVTTLTGLLSADAAAPFLTLDAYAQLKTAAR
jgi:malate synthase